MFAGRMEGVGCQNHHNYSLLIILFYFILVFKMSENNLKI